MWASFSFSDQKMWRWNYEESFNIKESFIVGKRCKKALKEAKMTGQHERIWTSRFSHYTFEFKKTTFCKAKSKQNLESEQWGWFIGSVSIYIYYTHVISLFYYVWPTNFSNPRWSPSESENLEALLIELTNAIHGLEIADRHEKVEDAPNFYHIKIIPWQVYIIDLCI